ncbi:hypothetical protein B0H13DRAFT_1895131 [Mycena leptocephala]|nr:hypothetical protein B0H13DRAFT_1895131 [Mycena leptocephala]
MTDAGNSSRYMFGVAPNYTLNSLRGVLLPRPEIQAGFRLQYNAQEVDPIDTPETLGASNKVCPLPLPPNVRYTYEVETALGPEDLTAEPLTPANERYWTWEAGTPPPGSIQVTPLCETRLRNRSAD